MLLTDHMREQNLYSANYYHHELFADPPVKGTHGAATDTKTISEGKSMEKFECALPESNPKTKAQW